LALSPEVPVNISHSRNALIGKSIKCGNKTGRRHTTILKMTTAAQLSIPSVRAIISLVIKSNIIGAAYPTRSITLIMACPSLAGGQRTMLTSNLRLATTQCREALPKRLQNESELSRPPRASKRREVFVIALTSS
jgi:alpha-D-ribose 1-methylphosphonate 5-triphosphate synthase subunit PhnH